MADFKLGRLKFKWRGDWAISTGYVIDDIVKYGGNSYVCIANHTSPNNENIFYTTPATYTTNWQLHGESLYFKGAYANSTWYKLNDLVSYGGKQYRVTTAHTSSSAVLDQSNFEQYSDGITFRGDYASSTQYRLNDLVKYGGRTYRVTTEHTSAAGGDINIDLANFSLYSEGVAFLDDWAATTYYRLDDVVKFGSYQYRCITAHTSGATADDFAQANFTIYSEGLQFEDSYNAGTVYSKGDVVTYGGYSYVFINAEEGAGHTPADNTYWDVVTTGFNATGVYVHGTSYKTGDTVQYGGNSYVCILSSTNQYPSDADGTVNATYWKIVVEGFKWRGTYDAATTYYVGDVVRYSANSYIQLKDRQVDVTPGSDATVWTILAQGDTAAVLTTRGDILYESSGGVARLPLGMPGGVLTNDGLDIKWSGISGKNILWVSPSGSDSNPGSESLPYKTVQYAATKAKVDSVREIENVSGGTGGTANVYNDVKAIAYKELTVGTVTSTTAFEIPLGTSTYTHTYVSGGEVKKSDNTNLTVTNAPYDHTTGIVTVTTSGVHGLTIGDTIRLRDLDYTCALGAKTYPALGADSFFRVDTNGGTVAVEIQNGTSEHNVGDKLYIDGSLIGNATVPITMDVKSVAGDILRIKNGTYSEILPLRIRAGISVMGETLRNTRVTPASGSSTQIKTMKMVNNPSSGKTNGEYKYLHPSKIEKSYTVVSTPDSTSFTINVGTDSRVHTYKRGGLVTNAAFGELVVASAPYDNATGVITITTTGTHGLSTSDVIKLSGLQYSCIDGEKTYPKVGLGAVFNVTVQGNKAVEINTYHGGSGFHVGDVITLASGDTGGSGDITLEVGSLEDNDASNMFLCNDANNIRNFTFTGLTGKKKAGGLYQVAVTSGTSFTVPTATHELAHTYVSGGNVISEFGSFTVNSVVDSTNFTIDLGTSAVAHTYLSGGQVRKTDGTTLTVADAPYVHGTGIITIETSTAHGLSASDSIKVANLRYSCSMGVKVYPKVGTDITVSNYAYAFAAGEITVNTNSAHGLTTGDWVTLGKAKFIITDAGERVLPKGLIMASVVSLDPSGNIKLTSPYIQNCTSVNAGACGMQVDGNLHKNTHTASYKSMLGNDFTQINSDGMGIHILGKGRVEAVSVFIYYCEKAIYAESGGFIRGLNCSHAYGEQACVASGTDEDEVPVNIQTRGLMLRYSPTGYIGGATVSDIENMISTQGQGAATIVGNTSSATATIFRFNASLNNLHIESITGNFTDGEVCTITKEDSSTFQITLASGFGTPAQQGQRGPLLAVKNGTTTLNATNIIKLASNVKFAGDTKYYRVGLVSEEDTTSGTAVIRLTEDIGTSKAKDESIVTEISGEFSNIRLTGHDFLNIGTGDFITTNYPGIPTQPADQDDEIIENDGGRIYWVSTDQQGDFRVGDLFKIEQATGTATLNADAFNLSGLSELKLGSIGAELGAAINEFSTDETLGGNANTAVPTENAILGYMTRDKAGTGAWVPPTGSTSQRPVGGALYTGAIRYNTSLVAWEGYNGSSWTGLGGGTPYVTIVGDGSTVTVAESNQRFLVNTAAAEATIQLPASPLTGDAVTFLDLNGTFATNKLTVDRNSNDIMNLAEDMIAETDHAAFTLVYTGAINGWKLLEVA